MSIGSARSVMRMMRDDWGDCDLGECDAYKRVKGLASNLSDLLYDVDYWINEAIENMWQLKMEVAIEKLELARKEMGRHV